MILTLSVPAMAVALLGLISTLGGIFCGTGAGGICCIWLPALGTSAAKILWLNASKANGRSLFFNMVTFGGN